jgi:hypothetical protein
MARARAAGFIVLVVAVLNLAGPSRSADVRQGVDVIRLRQIDGYGHPVITIVLKGRASGEAAIEIDDPQHHDMQTMAGALPSEAWSDIKRRAIALDQAPAEEAALGPRQICLDPPNFRLEIGEGRPVIHRNYCVDDPFVEFGVEIGKRSLAAFPACAKLTFLTESVRTAGFPISDRYADAFAYCGRLDGDKIAAAEVMNVAAAGRVFELGSQWVWDSPPSGDWAALVASDVLFRQAGRPPTQGAGAMLLAWRDLVQDRAELRVNFSHVVGLDSGDVRVDGELRSSGNPRSSARISQVWRRIDGQWRIVDWQVGVFRRGDRDSI